MGAPKCATGLLLALFIISERTDAASALSCAQVFQTSAVDTTARMRAIAAQTAADWEALILAKDSEPDKNLDTPARRSAMKTIAQKSLDRAREGLQVAEDLLVELQSKSVI